MWYHILRWICTNFFSGEPAASVFVADEDGGNRFLRNVASCLQKYMTSYPRTSESYLSESNGNNDSYSKTFRTITEYFITAECSNYNFEVQKNFLLSCLKWFTFYSVTNFLMFACVSVCLLSVTNWHSPGCSRSLSTFFWVIQ